MEINKTRAGLIVMPGTAADLRCYLERVRERVRGIEPPLSAWEVSVTVRG
jgi:hypothetical protein